MFTFFLTCAVVGGVLLIAQLLLGAVGGDHGHDGHDGHGAHDAASDGLHLLSVRALSAGVAFFGIGGLGVTVIGWPSWLALLVGAVLGVAAMLGVALSMRAMLRLERDASVRVGSAMGVSGTVYVPVPAARGGMGKVTLVLQGRTVELQAVTAEGRMLPTGAPVLVVDVRDDDTVEVVPLPTLDGVS